MWGFTIKFDDRQRRSILADRYKRPLAPPLKDLGQGIGIKDEVTVMARREDGGVEVALKSVLVRVLIGHEVAPDLGQSSEQVIAGVEVALWWVCLERRITLPLEVRLDRVNKGDGSVLVQRDGVEALIGQGGCHSRGSWHGFVSASPFPTPGRIIMTYQ